MGSKPSKFLHKAKIFEIGRDISVGFGLVLGMKFEDVLFFFFFVFVVTCCCVWLLRDGFVWLGSTLS